MRKMTRNQVIVAGLAIVATFIMAKCDNGTAKEDPKCPCPPNTVHEWNEPCLTGCVGRGNAGCNCTEKPEPTKDQGPKTINFGTGLSTIVMGNMTDTQWTAVIDKLTTALNAAAADGGSVGTQCAALFGAGVNT